MNGCLDRWIAEGPIGRECVVPKSFHPQSINPTPPLHHSIGRLMLLAFLGAGPCELDHFRHFKADFFFNNLRQRNVRRS